MTISEKAAYLKGLMDGLNLNTETNEGKIRSFSLRSAKRISSCTSKKTPSGNGSTKTNFGRSTIVS